MYVRVDWQKLLSDTSAFNFFIEKYNASVNWPNGYYPKAKYHGRQREDEVINTYYLLSF